LTFEDVDIVSVINGVVRELAHLSDSRKLVVSVVKDEHINNISGDQIALRRLIFNLLDNAIKFTGPGGTIELSAENQDDNVVVSVKDSGKGIAPEDLPKLFQRFWQGDPGKQYSVGTGLGLYLCRQIVEAHFGKIECKSAQDQGTIFSITLPARLILDA
jgi:NtrC-family two-component system sensor histidine kinase KinB